MSESRWVVHKFGGTSVANAERYRAAARIVLAEKGGRKAVVVSAMSGVTDALIELVELACKRDESYAAKLDALRARHDEAATALLPAKPDGPRAGLVERFAADFNDIKEVLRGVWQVRSCSEQTLELISGYGELWSAQLLDAYLRAQGLGSRWLDARLVLQVEPGAASVAVDWVASRSKIKAWLKGNDAELLVITGFIASTPDGIPTTLKRNGSDFSASIFGALLKASSITIWTDVDGVLSADPRLVPEAVVLDEMSYQEATELAYFGAKVVHPNTMAPAILDQIPIRIRNTFNPEAKGTLICERSRSDRTVKGFATIDGMVLVNVEGTGMIGVPGVAQRLFGALREVGVSVVMISQASSEHSICFAIPKTQAALAKTTVERAFFAELQQGQIQTVAVTDDVSVLAVVGDGMVERPGVAGQFFTALGRAGVSVRAIAQGSSERNISAVIDSASARRGLRAVHAAFYLSNQTLSIGVIGPGLIGGTFLRQLGEQLERLKTEFRIDLRVRGIIDSRKMLLAEQQLDLGTWKGDFEKDGKEADLGAFVRHIHAGHLPHAVLIDCTASAEVPAHYRKWLEGGIHVITPNKKGNTGSMASYRGLRAAGRAFGRHYLYETTVGAGLPVINTLRDLVQTGDRVQRIDGVFSGTLSYLFSEFDGRKPFSAIVKEARQRGYTEPDPRDDLSGMDVARKVVILAREMGLELELDDVQVQNLVPEQLRSGSIDQYLERLPGFDAQMTALLSKARDQGEVLRYVGVIQAQGKSVVELRSYPQTHPFARITAGDNIVAYQTARYDAQPLIVQGPGAGPEVTAGGVFADLLRLVAYLGGPR